MGLFDHTLHRFPLERAVAAVEDDGDSPFVGMVKNLVRPAPAIKRKPVLDQSGDLPSGGIPKLSIIDRHRSDGHCHAGFDGHLDFVGQFLQNAFPVFAHALDNHADDFVCQLSGAGGQVESLSYTCGYPDFPLWRINSPMALTNFSMRWSVALPAATCAARLASMRAMVRSCSCSHSE